MRGSNKRREERREKPVTMFLYLSPSLVSRLVRAIRITRGGLEPSAIDKLDRWRHLRNRRGRLGTRLTESACYPAHFHKTVSRVKRQGKKEMLKCGNVRCNRVSQARHVCLTLRANPSDWRKCWRKLSKLTSHRVYQELVTGMRHWQQWCLHAPPSPSLPNPHAVFAQNFLKPLFWSLEQATFALVNQQ